MQDSSHQSFRGPKTLWLGMFFSPVVWSVYHVTAYMLAEAGCMTPLLGFEVGGVSGLFIGLAALSLLAIGLIVWNGWWSYRSWRYYAAINPEEEHPLQAYDRDEFLALSGLLLSGTFLLVVILSAYPLFVLDICG